MAQDLIGSGTVLESPEHGPQLCWAVMQSNPPQGRGPDITNWDWSKVTGHESVDGTTWGDLTVVGTYAAGALTLTRPPTREPLESLQRRPDGAPPLDRAGHRAWGTPSTAADQRRVTNDELQRIAREVFAVPGAVMSAPGFRCVDLLVAHDDGTLQRELDQRYQPGIVRVTSALQTY
ncbi:hypothetical protein [Nocardioides aurantiacus]|uniref:Uncharacterized protein n=1 Tax=Nocardioides aurantiacus TaxID=86796 RepID=A0A3N2CTP4_9ACTN|nr:hypothetical protein [Nocardioides aurantiacus]ROR90909.1 hypothetical protein EDD33_1758 [Nocardioides aurantiacus]